MTKQQTRKIWRQGLQISAAGWWLAGCAAPPSGAPSGNGLQPPDFGAFYKATQQRLKEPPPSTSNGVPVVFIDVAALAARHPASKLAAALEKTNGSSLAFSALPAPNEPQAVELRSEPLKTFAPAPPQAVSEAEDATPAGEVAAYNRPPQRLSAREAVPLENAAQNRQAMAFAGFFNDVAERQQSTRDDLRLLWRSELEDEIEAAQRLSVTGVQPISLPAEVQLEMTNLRLVLGTAVDIYEQSYATNAAVRARALAELAKLDASRSSAVARLRTLDEEWREKLRLQENTLLEELKKLQFELPDKMRREGEVDIAQRLQRLSTRDATLRDTVTTALRERIAAGFTPGETGIPDGVLSIRLPGANLEAQRIENGPTSPATALAWARGARITHQINNGIISTIEPVVSSAGAFSGEAATNRVRPVAAVRRVPVMGAALGTLNRAQVLRRQARQDAERWAQSIARRRGWNLQTRRAPGTPDRTREALGLLNLS